MHSRKEICMPRTKTKVPKVDLLCASAYALTSLHTACVSPPRNSTIYTKAFLCLIYENEFRRGQETRRIQIRRESSIFVCFRCLSAAFSFSGVSASASGVSYREESFLHGADQVDHHTRIGVYVYIGAERTRTLKREKKTRRFEIRL